MKTTYCLLASAAAIITGPVCSSVSSAATGCFVPTIQYLRNFSYQVPRLSTGYDLYTLKNGVYEDESQSSVYFNQAAIGDLNHDGKADAAVYLSQSGGGSGVFGSLVILLNDGAKLKQLDYIDYPLGDRDRVTSLKIANNKILITKFERTENQTMADQPKIKRTIELAIDYAPQLQVLSNNTPKLTVYLADLSTRIAAQWQERIHQASESLKSGGNDAGPEKNNIWHLPKGAAKATIIEFDFRPADSRSHVHNMTLKQSSGNAYWDSIASSALSNMSDLDEVPANLNDMPTKLNLSCTFSGKTSVVKQISGPIK